MTIDRRLFFAGATCSVALCRFSVGAANALTIPASPQWWITAGAHGVAGAIGGAAFNSIMGWTAATEDQVRDIVARAVAELKDFIDQRLTERDIEAVTDQMSGAIEIYSEYERTHHRPTLDRASEEATLVLARMKRYKHAVFLVYPVAASLKLATLVSAYRASGRIGYVTSFAEVSKASKELILTWQREIQATFDQRVREIPRPTVSGLGPSPFPPRGAPPDRSRYCFTQFRYQGERYVFTSLHTVEPGQPDPCVVDSRAGPKLAELTAPLFQAQKTFQDMTIPAITTALMQWDAGEQRLRRRA
jgi:hypothetical protein